MKVLLDQCLPVRLRHLLHTHDVQTVRFKGWDGVKNGELIQLAAVDGFDAIITLDRGMQFEHDISKLPLGILVVRSKSSRYSDLAPLITNIDAALSSLKPGNLMVIGS